MTTFRSIAVLDTETTSLPENDHRTTKITELAILGCEIDHLRDSQELPRVLHKLVLLFNPLKTIHPNATLATALNNELLMNIKPFTEEDAVALVHFLSRLPSPVCIVAHNGNKFDFPVLRRTLQKAQKNLPNDIYCADTLKAFKELLPRAKTSIWTRCIEKQAKNEMTPKHRRTQPVNALLYKSVARKLFPDDEKHFPNNREFSEWACSQDDKVITTAGTSRPKSYKLRDIYYFYFKGYFTNSHRAEEDAEALLKCIIQCQGFLDWMSQNAVFFNSIKPL